MIYIERMNPFCSLACCCLRCSFAGRKMTQKALKNTHHEERNIRDMRIHIYVFQSYLSTYIHQGAMQLSYSAILLFIFWNNASVNGFSVTPPSFTTTSITPGNSYSRMVDASQSNLKNTWKNFNLRMVVDEDDEDYEEDDDDDDESTAFPLSEGINSVSWLPPLTDSKEDSGTPTSVRNGAEILPLFPLGGIVYTPNSEHVLNIFEPRYRSMYNDILMNGSKRFVVAMSHPEKSGVFAEVGVVFELQDLKEVSEETG